MAEEITKVSAAAKCSCGAEFTATTSGPRLALQEFWTSHPHPTAAAQDNATPVAEKE